MAGVALVVVCTLSAQPVPRLALQLEDYAQLPITGQLDGQNTMGQLARVNFMREEPGGRRFFVNDLNGPLYILDKQTKKFTVYLDFNGLGARPGLFPKFTFERNFATGLTNFLFDPDYARNGVFYTMHMEDPIGCRCAGAEGRRRGRPRSLRVRDHAGDSDADRRRADRSRGRAHRVDGPQSGQRDVRGHGARADAAAASAAAAPAGRDDLQSRRAARRSRLAGDVHRRRRFRLGRPERQPPHQPAAARHPRRQDPAHRARPARAHDDQHGQRERPLPDPQRQSLHDPRGRPQGDLGLRPAQPASADLGRRSGAAEGAAAAGVPHRAGVVGDGRRHPQGRELRLAAARRHAGAVARRHGPDPAGRHDSDPDLGHRDARHGQADLSGAAVPAPAGAAATPSPTGSSIAASRSPR